MSDLFTRRLKIEVRLVYAHSITVIRAGDRWIAGFGDVGAGTFESIGGQWTETPEDAVRAVVEYFDSICARATELCGKCFDGIGGWALSQSSTVEVN